MAAEPILVLVHQKTRQRFPLCHRDFVIGRSQGQLIFDHDPKLSSKHCLIRLTPSGLTLFDLKSRTGVLVNGSPLSPTKGCILKEGTQLTIGDQTFVLESATATAVTHLSTKISVITLVMLAGLAYWFNSQPPKPMPSAAVVDFSRAPASTLPADR